MTSSHIHDYIERLATLVRSENRSNGTALGLQPVHIEAMHFLSRCNRYSDTPMALTDYLGQTKGTVSQTLKILEKKELISKTPDTRDRRVTHLALTVQGRAFLEASLPSPQFLEACELLDKESQRQLAAGLNDLLRAFQHNNKMKTFGICQTCRHNQKNEDGSSFCLLTQENLSADDVHLICREHEDA